MPSPPDLTHARGFVLPDDPVAVTRRKSRLLRIPLPARPDFAAQARSHALSKVVRTSVLPELVARLT